MRNNPRVVPPVMEAIDPLQEGTPRTIRPIGTPVLHVGTLAAYLERGITMDNESQYFNVTTSEVRESIDGKSRMQFAEGTRVPLHTAHQYGLVDEAGVATARPEDEKPDVAKTDEPVSFRAESAAPENRMEAAPDNRKAKK